MDTIESLKIKLPQFVKVVEQACKEEYTQHFFLLNLAKTDEELPKFFTADCKSTIRVTKSIWHNMDKHNNSIELFAYKYDE